MLSLQNFLRVGSALLKHSCLHSKYHQKSVTSYTFQLISHGGKFFRTHSFRSKVVLLAKRNIMSRVTRASPKFHFTHFFLIIIIIIRYSGMFRDVPCSGFYRRPNTSGAVQLNGFFGKIFYFLEAVFSKCNFTFVFICFFICQCTFFTIFQRKNVFQAFSLIFIKQIARTIRWAVDKSLNGSFLWAVYFWKAKLAIVSRQHCFPRKPRA